MYKDKFVLSVLVDGYPVKETGPVYDRRVAIPFDAEYKVRLKNKHDRSCTARIFIDGKKASALGDLIIGSGGTVDLERFVDSSLTSGKKFKFVTLDNPEVDDPTSSDNGIIKVEFRLAKQNQINIQPSDIIFKPWVPKWDTTTVWYRYDDVTYTSDNSGPAEWKCKGLSDGSRGIGSNCSVNYVNCSAQVDNGATVEGGHSSQSFSYSQLEVEEVPVVLKLKMVGIKQSNKTESMFRYCSNCGYKMKRNAKYCSECGRRV